VCTLFILDPGLLGPGIRVPGIGQPSPALVAFIFYFVLFFCSYIDLWGVMMACAGYDMGMSWIQ